MYHYILKVILSKKFNLYIPLNFKVKKNNTKKKLKEIFNSTGLH